MLGTAVSVISVSLLALGGPQALSKVALAAIGQALLAALLMNITIVGINQLYDIEIDKINKPTLPLAAGDFSPRTGLAIVVSTGLASLAVGAASGSAALLGTLAISLGLGIVYSTELPFLRWKKHPVLAAACILAVRGVIVQLGFYTHAQAAVLGLGPRALALGAGTLPLTAAVSSPLAFTMAFMLLFSVVIALFKDVPDVKGDTKAGVRTLSVRLGPERVFWACIALLGLAYAGGVAYALLAIPPGPRQLAVALGHLALAAALAVKTSRVVVARNSSLVDFYMFIWALFYSEYLLIPLLP